MTNDGWYPDPAGDHELRYFDGAGWTDYVLDPGRAGVEQAGPAPANWPAYSAHQPGPAGRPGPAKNGHLLAIIAAGVALGIFASAALGAYLAVGNSTDRRRTVAGNSAGPRPVDRTRPGGRPTPGQPTPSTASATPRLKTGLPAASIVGPTFVPGEPTYTFAFSGWPFAFRGPASFGCMASESTLPGSKTWLCVDEQHPGAKQRVGIMLRPCPTTCTAGEQRSMETSWFSAPGQTPTRRDATTSYLTDPPRDDNGLYALDTSHFFGPRAGGPLKWQVGVYVESPPATKGAVLKLLNEVRTQTP